MADVNISLDPVGDITSVVKDLTNWLRSKKSDPMKLIRELKNNLIQLDLVVNHDVDLDEVIDRISTEEYARLQDRNFDFNKIKKAKIPVIKGLKGTKLESWVGAETAELIDSIYDKIYFLKAAYPHKNTSSKFRWKTRVINIRKRILLLMKHLRD